MRTAIRILACAAGCLLAPAAWAQAWPAKPIRVVVPYLPGATDVPIRLMSPKMQEQLGQPLVFEHHAGANGTIGADIVAKAAPDGYTLLYTNSNPLVFAPATQKNVPYDPLRDFTPILAVSEGIEVLVANPSLPAGNANELIAYAKANPGKVFYASSGTGGAQHIDGQHFNRLAGTNITAVQYVSFAQMIPAVLQGQVQLAWIILQPVKPLVAAGKLKIIAVGEPNRHESLPEVGTVAEALPGYVKAPGWSGLLAPARLPQPMVDRLYVAARNALNSPEVMGRLLADGNRVTQNNPEEFAARMKQGIESTARMIKELGINVTE
jgi:tripartite-type tricarboxylate transporter receptor subunit TctC